ncbi:MAG: hypothetical protein ABGW99_05510 [Zunongwangia sp.]|uniref:hypothetical protein n=1 Tax=Zunongwangia sp. TaxID=1965325 RepID=UPI003242D2F1
MNQFEIDEVINSLTRINSDRKYWFVRTQAGDFYETFLENSYIAIGYDTIRLSIIKSANENKHAKKALSEAIKKKFPEETRPGYIGNQLIDFTYRIKQGDIVVIPSSGSSHISIGEVKSTPVFEVNDPLSKKDCHFLKRKSIEWLKMHVPLKTLDSQLLRLKYTQRTVTLIPEDLTSYIDRNIVPLYVKDNNAHLALNVQKTDHLSAYNLFGAWADLLELADEFGDSEDIEINKEDFDIRINVQSPGTIEFISYSIIGLVALSVIVAAIIGAEFESNSKVLKFKFKTEGLLQRITKFLDKRQDRIMKMNLNEKLKQMDLKKDDVVQILKELNEKGRFK